MELKPGRLVKVVDGDHEVEYKLLPDLCGGELGVFVWMGKRWTIRVTDILEPNS